MRTRALLLLAFIIFCLPARAQIRSMTDADEASNSSEEEVAKKDGSHDWSAGAGFGWTKIYAQLPQSTSQHAYLAHIEKNDGPGFSYGLTATSGGLESSYPYYNLGSYNQFTSFDIHLGITFGLLFSALSKRYAAYDNAVTRVFNSAYFGVGVGAINNNIIRIKPLDTAGKLVVNQDSGKPIIKTSSLVPYLPFNAGSDLNIKQGFLQRIVFNINFQYTWCLGNYVDGYNMPFSGHKHTAVYTVASAGVRYYITQGRRGKKVMAGDEQ